MRELNTYVYEYDRRKRRYTVYTGNYCWHHFPQERQARKFLADLSRRYTARLKDLNEIYRQATNIAQGQLFSIQDICTFARIKAALDERLLFILERHTIPAGDRRGNYFHYSLLVSISNLCTRYVRYIQDNTRHLNNTGQDIALYTCARQLDVIRLQLHQHLQGRDYTTPATDLAETPADIPNQLKIAV